LPVLAIDHGEMVLEGDALFRTCYPRVIMGPRTNPLPEGFSARTPGWDDADAVAGLIEACILADGGEDSTTTEELLDDWHDVDLATEAVVVSAPDGRIAGYADVVNRANVVVSVYGYVHPEYRGRGVGAYLVAWGEDWTQDRISQASEDARVVVQHYVSASNESARHLLEGAGYAPVRTVYTMAIDLGQAPPPPEWPEGLRVRTFVPGHDERTAHEAVEDAFRDVWGRPHSPFERFVKMTEHEVFDPSLWFLARDGPEIAGLILCKLVAGQGWVDVVGVRRPWRGRGLGLALLRHAFGEYHRRGVKRIGLSVDAESVTGAPRLYSRAGMRVTNSYVVYQTEQRPGVDISVRS
jgi:mycothiol synthase